MPDILTPFVSSTCIRVKLGGFPITCNLLKFSYLS